MISLFFEQLAACMECALEAVPQEIVPPRKGISLPPEGIGNSIEIDEVSNTAHWNGFYLSR